MRKLLYIIVLFVSVNGWSQDFEGEIVYTLTYGELPEELQGMEGMMPQEMKFTISGSKIKLEQSYLLGSQAIVMDEETKKGFLLMDMLGQRMAIVLDASEEEETAELDYKSTSEKRVIQGYACTKYVATTAEGNEVYVWVTQDLKVDFGTSRPVKGIDGFPVSFTTSADGVETTCELLRVTKKVIPASEFEIPEDFIITTMESLEGGEED